MRWQINLPVRSPIVGLPHPQRHCPSIWQLQPSFTLKNTQTNSDITLGASLGYLGFEVHYTDSWEKVPPLPWQPFLGTPNPAEVKNAQTVEAAIVLRIFNVHELKKQQPLSAGKLYHQLTHENFPQNIQEAFAFALFDFKVSLDSQPVLEKWQNDVRCVVYEREQLQALCQPESILLNHGYQLLDLISQQRQNPPVSEEIVQAWEDFSQKATMENLPLVFSIVYWEEAAYRLMEIGDNTGTQEFLERQNQAKDELLTLVPHLSDNLAGGLWRHHLGRLAYLRGQFGEALQQYGMEWRLHHEQPASKERLQQSIACILSDMGYLENTKKLIQQILEKQRNYSDSKIYKTLSRLGETLMRQGEYAQAITYFLESWEKQPQKIRDGQTAIYLGHAHLLQNELVKAEEWYTLAEKADKKQNIFFNPYLLMGKIALFQHQGKMEKVISLWQTHKDKLSGLKNDEVLPMAIIETAVDLIDTLQGELLEQSIDKLIKENFLREAIYPLTIRFATPTLAALPLQSIIDGLNHWQAMIDELKKVTENAAIISQEEETALLPALLLKVLVTAQQDDSWQVLETLLPRIYPMNLLNR
ncbi:tetratricopeptide repeat protein [Candidatus Parabeggiatoa sp. HSG14]|uniref:tetratricopeptide repeat protein n=1 Tax=Candidatus Parabeggiatoa sp. HSG14 TaxID=3055593 RepID=UPI0025A8A559|nr:tetratricopeptide repeat protein [Thiotrichales bacterium HSG14]